MREVDIQDKIRLAIGNDPDIVLWRNNIGVAERNGHMIRFGVGNKGGADLIGMFRGRFLAIEVKSASGRLRAEQKLFAELVERRGGIFVVLRSAQEAIDWLTRIKLTTNVHGMPIGDAS